MNLHLTLKYNSIQFNSSQAPADNWYDGLEVSKLSFPNWGLIQS